MICGTVCRLAVGGFGSSGLQLCTMAEQVVQRFSPVLVYDDADRAIEFLEGRVGFAEVAVHRTPDGAVAQAELSYLGGVIGLSDRIPGTTSLFDFGPSAIYVVVDEPDAHHDRADAAGANVVMPLTDQDYGST